MVTPRVSTSDWSSLYPVSRSAFDPKQSTLMSQIAFEGYSRYLASLGTVRSLINLAWVTKADAYRSNVE